MKLKMMIEKWPSQLETFKVNFSNSLREKYGNSITDMHILALFLNPKFKSLKIFHTKFNDIGLSSENILANLKLLQDDESSEDVISLTDEARKLSPIRPKQAKVDIFSELADDPGSPPGVPH